jgi:predicted HAD superfamily Cof-like phosphohydrolase
MSTNVFEDQKFCMEAWGQSTTTFNPSQYNMYLNLVSEEYTELQEAIEDKNAVEQIDALADIIVVCAGALLSRGVNPHSLWNEVIRSNKSKIDPETGTVLRREDGKVIKPATFSEPNLAQFLENVA